MRKKNRKNKEKIIKNTAKMLYFFILNKVATKKVSFETF